MRLVEQHGGETRSSGGCSCNGVRISTGGGGRGWTRGQVTGMCTPDQTGSREATWRSCGGQLAAGAFAFFDDKYKDLKFLEEAKRSEIVK